LNGSYNKGLETSSGIAKSASSSVTANLVVPLFSGGGKDHTAVRSAKETLGQKQIQIDLARETVKQALSQAWGIQDAAVTAIGAAGEEIKGRETVVAGYREEYKVGQRILQNVLVEENNLNNARVRQIGWQRDRIFAQYSVLAAMGQLNSQSLNLKVQSYDEKAHYDATRDAWLGTRTPDGR
jgi:outer membrane protein